jgi:hypothetical protein
MAAIGYGPGGRMTPKSTFAAVADLWASRRDELWPLASMRPHVGGERI